MIDLTTTSRQYLLPEELAEIFLVSKRTVYHWIEDGRVYVVRVAHSVRIPIAEARRLLRVHAEPDRRNLPPGSAHSVKPAPLVPPSS